MLKCLLKCVFILNVLVDVNGRDEGLFLHI